MFCTQVFEKLPINGFQEVSMLKKTTIIKKGGGECKRGCP